MRQARFLLKHGWIFLWVWLLCASGHAAPGAATDPHVLRDVWVLHQNGQWHVVLIVSESVSYTTIEASDPRRLVVDLPNTLSKTVLTSPIRENEIIGTVKSATVVHEPQPLTRVEIGLKRDTSYQFSRLKEKIWVTFDKAAPTPKVEPASAEQVGATEAEDPLPKSKATQETTATWALAEGQTRPSPPPARKNLPVASKIITIEPMALDEDLDVHIIGDGRFDNYDVSLLSNPPRLVVDLLGVKSTEVKDDLTLSGPWVRKVRVGQHPDRVRVVFDLASELFIGPERELPYQIILEKNRMVISFLPISGVPAQ